MKTKKISAKILIISLLSTTVISNTITPVTAAPEFGWEVIVDKAYWYEGDAKQGTYDDNKGVMGYGTVRGREIYDPDSDAWFWLDSVYDGAKAVDKEVWMPYIYQNEEECNVDDLANLSKEDGTDLSANVKAAIENKTGKWVRYDSDGHMIKGWFSVTGNDLEEIYPEQSGNTYYYDVQTGLMAKGWVTIDGKLYHFDEVSGVLIHEHNYEWTYVSDGDYKVNKCSCGQETGERAYNLGNGVYGQWKDSMASDLMTWTNLQRGNTTTNPVDEIGNHLGVVVSPPLNNTLSSQAKTRALQCVSDYSHNGMITTDECLAQGYSDVRSVSSAWMASGDHRDSSVYYLYTQGGTACLWYDSDGNGTMSYIWVLVLDY